MSLFVTHILQGLCLFHVIFQIHWHKVVHNIFSCLFNVCGEIPIFTADIHYLYLSCLSFVLISLVWGWFSSIHSFSHNCSLSEYSSVCGYFLNSIYFLPFIVFFLLFPLSLICCFLVDILRWKLHLWFFSLSSFLTYAFRVFTFPWSISLGTSHNFWFLQYFCTSQCKIFLNFH